jgi:hypothetical protein
MPPGLPLLAQSPLGTEAAETTESLSKFGGWLKSVSMDQATAVGTGVATAVGLGQNMADRVGHYKDMDFKTPLQVGDGMPSSLGMSGLWKQSGNIDWRRAGKGMVGQGIGAGAQLGAAVGSIVPGLGTVVGAGIGAAAGTLAGLFGRGKARKEAKEAKQRGFEAAEEAQAEYNEGVEDYYAKVDAQRADIQHERNRAQSVYRLGNLNSPFASIV